MCMFLQRHNNTLLAFAVAQLTSGKLSPFLASLASLRAALSCDLRSSCSSFTSCGLLEQISLSCWETVALTWPVCKQ